MPPEELPDVLWMVLGGLGFLMLVVLLMQWRMSRRLKRIELRQIRDEAPSGAAEQVVRKSENKEQKQYFQEFIAEDPSRSELPKKEQFEAFRKWRKQKGLNWSS